MTRRTALHSLLASLLLVTGCQPAASVSDGTATLESHYAPAKPLVLNCADPLEGRFHIGFGPGPSQRNLSSGGNLVEAAANLFSALHEADASSFAGISVAPIPNEGIGIAINDRLRRAAA